MRSAVPRPPTPRYELRRSPVHGDGLFAVRTIRKGTRVVEYVGERISHEEADRRHDDRDPEDNHTFLFTVDEHTVVDGGVNGNEARFINHSCAPNCEVVVDDGHLWVVAERGIRPGEELSFDYSLNRSDEDTRDVERIYACRCGEPSCRGSMLEPLPPPRAARRRARGAEARA